ncbi:hypothetical protein TNCV_667041 [Trichonephila clavipes]|nr:hypothetical protein TNCV_667041 [Trichonephila clavipes]
MVCTGPCLEEPMVLGTVSEGTGSETILFPDLEGSERVLFERLRNMKWKVKGEERWRKGGQFSDYICRLNVLFKMSVDKFNKKAGKDRKRNTTSVDDRRIKILCFRDKRISWTPIRRDLSDSGVSVS